MIGIAVHSWLAVMVSPSGLACVGGRGSPLRSWEVLEYSTVAIDGRP